MFFNNDNLEIQCTDWQLFKRLRHNSDIQNSCSFKWACQLYRRQSSVHLEKSIILFSPIISQLLHVSLTKWNYTFSTHFPANSSRFTHKNTSIILLKTFLCLCNTMHVNFSGQIEGVRGITWLFISPFLWFGKVLTTCNRWLQESSCVK